MGYLLKEALKILCGVNQWSYAVFWKFGCQNPKLLIWEECFYEPVPYSNLPGISGVVNSEPGFDNWDTCWVSAEAGPSQLAAPSGNKVHLLVNKMMMENHVNVVGEGLVGRAAFTGNHQWILSENYSGVAHPPEVLKEVCQQFSAGMQTVAVIPVFPHGVVQLGSCLAVLENLGFVNDVKTLVRNLGCVPGVLLSDNYTTKEPAPNIGFPVYPGKTLETNSSVRSDVIHFTPFIGSFNNQVSSTQTAGCVGQTSSSLIEQVLDGKKSTVATFQASNMVQDLGKIHDEHCQAKILSLTKPNLPSMGQLSNGVTKAEVIPSNPKVWLSQQASLYSPRSTFVQESSISSLAVNNGSSRMLEGRILPDAGFQNQNDNNLTVSDGSTMSPLIMNTCLISSSHEIAVTTPSVEVSEILKDANSHVQPVPNIVSLEDANRSFHKNIPCTKPGGDGFLNASSSKTESSSCMMDKLTTNHLEPCGSVSDHQSADNIGVKTKLNEKKEGMENDLFRGISIPLPRYDEHLKLGEHIPGFTHGDEKLYGATSSRSLEDSKYDDACMQQSGDDLFDILGVDFRYQLLNGSWNNVPNNGSYSNAQNYKNKSTSLTTQDAASELYSVNQGNSESGIFSATGSDSLLDAVVSRVHPSTKQNLDDNISCKTTLTNISNSSGLATSHSYGRAGVSDQMQGELFGFPKSLLKAGAMGSSSFKSGSSKDNAGTYSQSSSIYGSQISSWVEQSHDIKQSSSASTSYSKKPDEMSKTNRKRLKPGENPRPRPKDRQMIQDRVKELREIVPNGAKCSIDALLERTIKHMLFLQSVAKHADKLKQTGESKILSKDGGLLLKDNYEGGATWAYEVGSQSMVCPIIVEDLNQPRQMLVEMLCEERGLFLEIADIIRGLGLTILKGVMETRNEKIWARFAVEANRDVTRMEIFISLVRLLEQTAKCGATPTNGIDNDSMMVHQFHQATSIPATGKHCGLQ